MIEEPATRPNVDPITSTTVDPITFTTVDPITFTTVDPITFTTVDPITLTIVIALDLYEHVPRHQVGMHKHRLASRIDRRQSIRIQQRLCDRDQPEIDGLQPFALP